MVAGTGLQTAAAAVPVPTTVTLPLFGAPLTIDITTGPGGALTDVSVDPADRTVATQAEAAQGRVRERQPPDPAGDPGKVTSSSRATAARASRLAPVHSPTSPVPAAGAATCSVMALTSTVDFTIGAAADGGPDITGITASAGGEVGEVKPFRRRRRRRDRAVGSGLDQVHQRRRCPVANRQHQGEGRQTTTARPQRSSASRSAA